jgi:2',5'-phosphodiesterase
MKISCAKALKEPVPATTIEGDAPPKKMQKGERSPLPDPDIQFRSSEGIAVVEGTLSEVLNQSTDISIESEKYRIVRDPPLVTSLEIESNLWVGFPLVASWSCVGAPEDEFTFEWLVMSGENQEVVDTIRCGQVFIPEPAHVGHYLEVRCFHPSFPEFYLSTAHVDRIEKFTGEKEARLVAPLVSPDQNAIRVATFNILAQPYLRTPLAQDVYYTHLHKCWYLTEWTRRLPLILREMTDTDSDIYCLQEVAGGSHETQLKRAISTTHDWHFFGKESLANNGNPIGVAICLRKSKFEVVEAFKLNLGRGDDGLFQSMLTEDERAGLTRQFGELFFGPVLKGLHTCAGVVHARTIADGRDVLIANTHLFFHPFGGHIRVLQGVCLMRKLAEMRESIAREGKPEPAIIVCGDFNSRPDSGSFHVMSSGSIPEDHIDWQYGRSYRYECYTTDAVSSEAPSAEDDEAATVTVASTAEFPPTTGIGLSHPLNIKCLPSVIPELTHATASFRSTLDYIFFSSDALEAIEGPGTGSSIPQLTHAEVDRMGGLPFDYYGSDHVLVCGDIRFK